MNRLLLSAVLALTSATAVAAQGMPGTDHAGQASPTPSPAPATNHSAHDMSAMDHAGHDMADMPGMDHAMAEMTGALGSYPMTREASGTSWQPDASEHAGVHVMRGDWTLMGHALLNGVYDSQSGPRGDDKAFVSGMIMGMARRDFGVADTLQFKAMLSPDPFMDASGYPLLLAAGETANGRTTLVDRQHPHDLFMELSASWAHRFSDQDSAFLYAGLPGEPAFGPPTFMHRQSIMDSPEAPISHHWLDSTHIVFGVVTAGWVHGDWKIEASRFKGREPDQHRFDIESPKLDSTAARISWNPTANWSLQASWADQKSPEQLEPDENLTRWSAGAIYTVPVGAAGWWSSTFAWGRKSAEHGEWLDAFALESAVAPNDRWTLFARAERIDTDELLAPPGQVHGPTFTVSKATFGAVRDFRVAEHVKVGFGAQYAFDFVPGGLKSAYGDDPHGVMGFMRLKVQ
jgi:hypothetical protein